MNLGAWGLLGLAILLEVAATSVLKLSNGFEKPLLGGLSIALYSACSFLGNGLSRCIIFSSL